MRGRTLRCEAGQATSEYALVVAGIAVACALAVLFLGGVVNGVFGNSAELISSAPFRPPAPLDVTFPTTAEECVDGGWRDYPQFADEAECLAYVDGLTP